VLSGVAGSLSAGVAMAADPWAGVSGLSLDIDPYIAGVVIVVTALTGIWIGRKLIKLFNKS
jgi:hypothetical protein